MTSLYIAIGGLVVILVGLVLLIRQSKRAARAETALQAERAGKKRREEARPEIKPVPSDIDGQRKWLSDHCDD